VLFHQPDIGIKGRCHKRLWRHAGDIIRQRGDAPAVISSPLAKPKKISAGTGLLARTAARYHKCGRQRFFHRGDQFSRHATIEFGLASAEITVRCHDTLLIFNRTAWTVRSVPVFWLKMFAEGGQKPLISFLVALSRGKVPNILAAFGFDPFETLWYRF